MKQGVASLLLHSAPFSRSQPKIRETALSKWRKCTDAGILHKHFVEMKYFVARALRNRGACSWKWSSKRGEDPKELRKGETKSGVGWANRKIAKETT